MTEMQQTIQNLREAAAMISGAADRLYRQFSGDGTEQQDPSKEKEAKPEWKLADVRGVLAEKSRSGHTAEVRELLKSHGADKLSQVEPKFYEELMAEAEAIGNGS